LEPFIIVFVAEKGEREGFTFTSICIDEENKIGRIEALDEI